MTRHLLASLLLPLAASAASKLQFNRDIRPILSDKCFHCHGFDPKKREADLRLDQRDSAIKEGHIVPGKADQSQVIARMTSHDPDEVMPPPKSKLGRISEADIALVRQWINEGAEYEAHWSFIPLKPEAAAPGKSIDTIVENALSQRGLKLQPPASSDTLRRRLSFDLTGLPPQDRSDQTDLSDQITALLASPAYGERMAADWLDLARYADSYGFQVDRERDVWAWRDWVVSAFNRNLPYDQFMTWQVAGDLLPNATDEQHLATAFNRLHQQESEGGSVEEEYRVEYVCDRVQTFATAFIGLTFECARCHDHKFDPIAQRDYYGLFGMFQNIDEAGLYSYFTPTPPTPALMMKDDAQAKKLADLQQRVAAIEHETAAPSPAPPAILTLTFDDLKPAQLKGQNKAVPGKQGRAVQFSGDDAFDLTVGNYHAYDPFTISARIQATREHERAVVFHRSRAWTDAASRGYELLIEEGKLKWSLIHFWPGNAISIRAKDKLPLNHWHDITVTNDGSSRATGLKIIINGKPIAVDIIRDGLTRDITGGGGDNISLGERFRDRGFKGGLIDDFQVFSHDITTPTNEPLRKARADLIAFTDTLKDLMTMRELPQPKGAHLLFRGEYDKRTDPVPDAAPEWIAKMPPGAPNNRLGLAQWLTSPQHPLFARVTVNRVWQSLFGRGLVKTSEDFGSQSARPLYPELLDYLAVKFMRSGWDMKALIREIVSSRVYQQRSIADAQVMADDPDNEWLARGPRFRLPAEMIRDNALAAAGLLNLKLGGPPVQPYDMSEAFKPATPTDVFRRSLYTHWRRTAPPPAMVAFDAPRRAVCTAKRERTDSPLQALILLNGTQYVEAARVLGEKLHREANGDVPKMIDLGFQRCLSRAPDTKERSICERLYREQLQHFQAAPAEAAALLKTGKTKADGTLKPADAAAATILAQALLNHDECVVKH